MVMKYTMEMTETMTMTKMLTIFYMMQVLATICVTCRLKFLKTRLFLSLLLANQSS